MIWKNAAEFFAMGGYATYVWGAYAATALLMGFEAWLTVRRRRRALKAVASGTTPEPRA